MKRIMAVYDVDPFYADRFAEFANEKEKTPFTVVAFSSLESLKKFAGQHEVEILLAGGNVPEEDLEEVEVGQIVHLSEDGSETERSVYKYQSTDAVLREVMSCYQAGTEATPVMSGMSGYVIGVYSPIGRCGKTGFCLTLGQCLAEKEKVLYLNFEACSGLSQLMKMTYKGTLSDLVYYNRMGEYSRMKLATVLYNWGNLDYVPPVTYAEDMADITGRELAQLVDVIARDGLYGTLILDIGNLGKDAESLLELCKKIYVPTREDCVSAVKLEEWKEYIAKSGRGKILEKMQILRLPMPRGTYQADTYLERLAWGEMGEFVSSLLSLHGGGDG